MRLQEHCQPVLPVFDWDSELELRDTRETRDTRPRQLPRGVWVLALVLALAVALAAPLALRGRAATTASMHGALLLEAEESKSGNKTEEPAAKRGGDNDTSGGGNGTSKETGDAKGEDSKPAKPTKPAKPVKIPDQGLGWPQKVFQPTLFCWSVMNFENADEVATIKGQLRNHTGIFGCDSTAVLSGKRMFLGYGHNMSNGTRVKVYSWLNPAKKVPMGNLQGGDDTNSFKNANIFIQAWKILNSSGAVFGHDWTVKVDPDAVFFAHRLRGRLIRYKDRREPIYLKNCDRAGPQLYGALEVFNEQAMIAYKEKGLTCDSLPWGGWGEDKWADQCMQHVGAEAQSDYELVGDHRCMSAECYDTVRAAFHDYKTEALYYECWQHSTQEEKIKDDGYFCCSFTVAGDNPCQACPKSSRQWPAVNFCGGSQWACSQCGAATKWCRMVGDKAELALEQ
mmetsp:Transcript_45635/g.105415  ORF Transcript_45635/g.105415 Transcript_45635/m.105415 type:complete len:453 (-) Transcript_45635:68-1426(-)